MMIGFSKPEIRALHQICQGESTLGELAGHLGVTPGFVSRPLRGLEEKGLIDIRREGIRKMVKLSMASHAQNFKLLSDSRPEAKMERWLSGFAMDVLMATLVRAPRREMMRETGCSRAALYDTIKRLRGAGVLFIKLSAEVQDSQLMISDPLLKEFVISYADNLELNALREVKGHNAAAIRTGKRVVVRTDAREVPAFFTKTGVSELAKNGLEAILTSYNDYCFDLDRQKRPVSLEEAFIHALLVTTRQHRQDMTVLAIFFAKNHRRLDLRALIKFAKIYGVGDALYEVRGKTGFYEKMRDMER